MPSTSRREFLAAVGATSLTGVAGCSVFGGGRPDVNTVSGLDEPTSRALDDEAVYLAGDTEELPEPPKTAPAVAEADLVLATPSADRASLGRALRAGKPVAFAAGGGVQRALRGVLERVDGDYSFGVEAVRARPVETVVAVPDGNDSVETYTFVDDGGWPDSVLTPLGWALVGRVPECRTGMPASPADDQYDYAGAAHVVGRLDAGEAYASRTVASVNDEESDRFVRLRTTLHAAANDGYAVEVTAREADFPDDQRLASVYPNSHTRDGVQVANVSDTTRSTFAVEATPTSDRARSALTACGGLLTEGGLAYDHRTSFRWKRDTLLETDRHYATATGRGEWRLGA